MNFDLIFKWEDDDTCSISLNGQPLITANHDDHGWDGMTGIVDSLRAAARLVGGTIEVHGQAGI